MNGRLWDKLDWDAALSACPCCSDECFQYGWKPVDYARGKLYCSIATNAVREVRELRRDVLGKGDEQV